MDNQATYVIDVKDLVKEFGCKRVVDQVSLQVKSGEIYGFLGPNGSGKTTTIRMICGLLEPTSGGGTCLGLDLQKDAALIKRQVGYMTQHFSLYEDLSIKENLAFIAQVYELDNQSQRVNDCLTRLGISTSRAKQLAGNLSGGWKQRLALGAAILHEPKLLLLDEPTAGVDPKARREFWDQIHALSREGITTLVSTHYMDEAERCHQLAYIAYGKCLSTGTIREVISRTQLITYDVEGEFSELVEATLDDPKLQVFHFGKNLHISSTDQGHLTTILNRFPNCRAEKIPTGLEDVFIYFMSHAEDNFS